MRFHSVIILTEAVFCLNPVAPRGVIHSAEMNCGPPRICLGSLRRGEKQNLHFRNVPVGLSISTYPCEVRAAGDTAHTHQKASNIGAIKYCEPQSPQSLAPFAIFAAKNHPRFVAASIPLTGPHPSLCYTIRHEED